MMTLLKFFSLLIALVAIQTLTVLAGGVAPSNGPASGGNAITITGVSLGGGDITNVMICGVSAAIQSQTTNSVTVITGSGGAGAGDVVVQSASQGATTFVGAYTYNPQGYISGDVLTWSSVSNLPVARGLMGAAVAGGRIYAMGGYNFGYNSAVYSYDPVLPTQGWSSVAYLPVSRAGLTGASVGGKIYSIGGLNDAGSQSAVYVYDPQQPGLGWLSISNLPMPLYRMATAVANDKIYVLGGEGTNGTQSAVYEYNPLVPTQGWRQINNLPVAMNNLAATAMDGKLYSIGGGATGGIQSSVYVCDLVHPELGWSSISNLPAPRYVLTAESLNGKIFAVGGFNASQTGVNTVYMYDPVRPTQGWLSVGNLPTVKGESPCAVVNGKMYVISGASAPLTYQSTVYEGAFATGVIPMAGSVSGGTEVTISGSNLGNGGDITNVTLCGVVASIISQSATQVVVMSGASDSVCTGAVVVSSVSRGIASKVNAYVYMPPTAPVVLAATSVLPTSFQANWTSVAGVTAYRLEVSASSNFTSFLSGFNNLNVGTNTTAPVSGLTACSAYYYRVRSQQGEALSTNSGVMSVITLNQSVLIASAGSGGSITPSGSVHVPLGFDANFLVQASDGFHIAQVLVDNQPVGEFTSGSNSFEYAFSSVMTNHTISATFNSAPVIGVFVDPVQGVAPLRVKFDFASSSDLQNNIVRSEVDQNGDGIADRSADGKAVIIGEYASPGIYTNTLKVTDGFGLTDSTSVVVTVWGQAPTAAIVAMPVSGPAPLLVGLVGTNSAAALGHQIVIYEWDFDGDGIYDQISRTGQVSHVYRSPGAFAAMLRITDDQGLQGRASVGITVAPPVLAPPSVTLQASPDIGAIPLLVTFVAVVSNAQPVVEYRWDFDGDGIMDLRTTTGSATHLYSAVGTYPASVTVVDTNGLSGKSTVMVIAREASNLRVWIVQPKSGHKVSGNAVSVNANAVPASQVASVQIQYRQTNGTWLNISTVMIPPPADFKTTWCVTNLANGTACELRAIALDTLDNILTSEVVAVTVDSSNGNSEGDDAGGKHTKQQTFTTNETAQVEVYDGTSVTVPLGTVDSNVTVQVMLTGTNTNPNTGAAYGQANIQMNREVSLDGHPDLKKPVAITIPYPDENNDGIVDGTSIPESTLQAYWFDTTDNTWKKPLSCEVNTSANFVKITTYHLTEFGLYGSRNLLLKANGGMLKTCSFSGTNVTSAANLTDGNTSSYWLSPTNPGPQEFVYGFTNFQGAICSELVLYNCGAGTTNYSKDYQIWGAMDVAGTNFMFVTNGLLPEGEGPVVVGMGNVTFRVVKLVITSGYGVQWAVAEFELHGIITADPNGNGMSDAWEMQHFGTVERTGFDDYDMDNLTDLNEFIHAANPMTNDTDGDGMTDGWEVQYGFQVATNDAASDSDGDGMSNWGEYIAGTNPTNTESRLQIARPVLDGTWFTNVYWHDGEWVSWDTNVWWYGDQWVTGAWMNVERCIFDWETVSGRTYRLYSTTNLSGLWQTNSQGISGTGGRVIVTNDMLPEPCRFFKIGVEIGP